MDQAALRAYASAMQDAARAAGGGVQDTNPAPDIDFGAMVQDMVSETEAVIGRAEQLTGEAAVGQAELVDVVTAVAAAEVQLETVIAVRDQVIRAYQDILRMPI